MKIKISSSVNIITLLKSLTDISRTCSGSISHYQLSFKICAKYLPISFCLDSDPRLVCLKYGITQSNAYKF